MQAKPLEIVTTSPAAKTKCRRTARQWQELMQAYEVSGLSQQVFCQQQGVALSTFYSWRKKLRSQSEEKQVATNQFVSLTPPQVEVETVNDWDVELSFANGMTLRLRT